MDKALDRLIELDEFTQPVSIINMSPVCVDKIKSTLKYTMTKNPDQDLTIASKRILTATVAEFRVAEHMNGNIANYEVNYENPFTYGFDVLSSIDFYGARIEVKTHQSSNKWISVNIDHDNPDEKKGLNVVHFLDYNVSDLIVIYRTNIKDKLVTFKNTFVGNQDQLKSVIKKSRYNGWYIDI